MCTLRSLNNAAVTYTLGWADTYNVEVDVNGKALDDSPFRVVASEK